MENVFLYFLGAGASCNALPLASQFVDRLASLARDIESSELVNGRGEPGTSIEYPPWSAKRDRFLGALKWLADETSRHYSVDTFAKKLFLRRDRQNLKKLKAVVSAFLIIEQSRKYVDSRYDAFLASILEQDESLKIRLPEKLLILTWNYDTQLEKAFYGFCEDEKLVWERITFNPLICRLNGYCGTHPPGHITDSFRTIFKTSSTLNEVWKRGVELYEKLTEETYGQDPDICFAWEDVTKTRLKNRPLELSNVSEIIIIGYSFPYFNREIDEYIFKQFGSNLSRVYLQYPEGIHSSIEDRLPRLPPDVEVIRKVSKDLFHIPDNLSPTIK
jgi:hypothetical protein